MEIVHEGWLSEKPQSEKKLFRIDRKLDIKKPDEYLFTIETSKRTYNLLASTNDDLNRWLKCLCTVCGFKSNQSETINTTLLLVQDQFKSKHSDIIVISYSNPNLTMDNSQFDQFSTVSPNKNLLNNQLNDKRKKLINFDNVTKKWTNCSSTLNRNANKIVSQSSTFSSATLPIRKSSSISSAYIPISECHTGRSIFDNSDMSEKKSTNNNKIEDNKSKFDVKFDEEESSNKCESNKENKFNDLNKTQSLLDSSINSTSEMLLNSYSRPTDLSNEDSNYDIPKQMKISKRTKIKDLLNIVPPPAKEELVHANAKSLPSNAYDNLFDTGEYSQTKNLPLQNSNSNLVSNNYINSIDLDRRSSFRETTKEREYYKNLREHLSTTLSLIPPPRPTKPISISTDKKKRYKDGIKSTSLNSLNDFNQNDIEEFDPLHKQQKNDLMKVPKPPVMSRNSSVSPYMMYCIPKSQIELELEKRTKSFTKNSLDTVVPLTHNLINNGKDELHRYTNAAPDVISKSVDKNTIIYDYERPILPCHLNSLHDDQFKIPLFKLNDKNEPITPGLIVTSTPLFSYQRHFNFNDQDEDTVFKPLVNRDLKPKKSDTSIESFLLYTNASPNNRHSDTLIHRNNLSSSFHKQSSSTTLNLPKVHSRGRQHFNNNKVSTCSNENEVFNDDFGTKKSNRTRADHNEIQYLDLDLDCENISLNSTINETSINLNFKDIDLTNSNHSNIITQNNQLNNSLNAQSSLNYSHFLFSNKQQESTQTNQSHPSTLNSPMITNASTVYKTVDFVKTKAFNELKDGLIRKTQD